MLRFLGKLRPAKFSFSRSLASSNNAVSDSFPKKFSFPRSFASSNNAGGSSSDSSAGGSTSDSSGGHSSKGPPVLTQEAVRLLSALNEEIYQILRGFPSLPVSHKSVSKTQPKLPSSTIPSISYGLDVYAKFKTSSDIIDTVFSGVRLAKKIGRDGMKETAHELINTMTDIDKKSVEVIVAEQNIHIANIEHEIENFGERMSTMETGIEKLVNGLPSRFKIGDNSRVKIGEKNGKGKDDDETDDTGEKNGKGKDDTDDTGPGDSEGSGGPGDASVSLSGIVLEALTSFGSWLSNWF